MEYHLRIWWLSHAQTPVISVSNLQYLAELIDSNFMQKWSKTLKGKKMKKSLKIAILLLIVLTSAPLLACTAFFASQGDKVLVGNNEDYINPITKIWFEPAEDKKYGRVYSG